MYLSEKENDFSDKYIEIRTKENRFLTDFEVKKLPFSEKSNPNYKEWKLRQQTANKIINYLKNKKKPLNILDLGCGNGWFTNLLREVKNSRVTGIDVNCIELEQANKVFKHENLQFVYGDIFKITSFCQQFNCIILNASAQYFPNFKKLIQKLDTFLLPNGEIHIIDSPFYKSEELNNAKNRTDMYYLNLGYPEMSNFYYHHSITEISNFKIMYKPSKNKFYNFLKKKSPFMWLVFTKN